MLRDGAAKKVDAALRKARAARRRGRHLRRRSLITTVARFSPYIGVEHQGLVFLAPTRRAGVGRALFVRGKRPEFAGLERAVQLLTELGLPTGGTTLVDVGANIGTTTVAGLLRHGFSRAVSIEPDPHNLRLLRANVALNDLEGRVEVVAAAASDRRGRLPFARGEQRGRALDGTGALLVGEIGDHGVLDVDVTTIDEALAERAVDPSAVGLLWLDVQGHEWKALAGAGALLVRRVPVVTAFRPELLGADVAALATLADRGYGAFVDLREPNVYGREWACRQRRLADLASFVPRGTSTDLLLVPV